MYASPGLLKLFTRYKFVFFLLLFRLQLKEDLFINFIRDVRNTFVYEKALNTTEKWEELKQKHPHQHQQFNV